MKTLKTQLDEQYVAGLSLGQWIGFTCISCAMSASFAVIYSVYSHISSF